MRSKSEWHRTVQPDGLLRALLGEWEQTLTTLKATRYCCLDLPGKSAGRTAMVISAGENQIDLSPQRNKGLQV